MAATKFQRARMLLVVMLAAAALGADTGDAAEPLRPLGAELDATSVSGLSSGAYMAGQIELAHSKQMVGAGIVAGGPFACAETPASSVFPFWPWVVGQNAAQALYRCMKTTWGEPDVPNLAKRAKELAEDGKIDALEGLGDDKVYLFSGNEDDTVTRPVVKAAERLYGELGVPSGNTMLIEDEGGHAFITEQGGAACGITAPPFVSDCDYDQAKAILGWIYGPLEPAGTEPTGQFVVFDQQAFAEPDDGLADEGIVYISPSCRDQAGCRVHVALHGCGQSREKVGDTFVKESGFTEIADTNRLIVLFPQVKSSPVNLDGCWDWWGYTGLDYLGKDAPQIAAIWSMVEQLAKAR